MQQRLYDADAQLASMSGDVDQHVQILNEAQQSRAQQAGKLREAEEEVDRIARQLAQAQQVVAQLKDDVSAVSVSLQSSAKHAQHEHVISIMLNDAFDTVSVGFECAAKRAQMSMSASCTFIGSVSTLNLDQVVWHVNWGSKATQSMSWILAPRRLPAAC